MVYKILCILSSGIIVALVSTLRKMRHQIRALQATLAEERRKRSMPLLTLEVNTETDYGVFLINDSYCYAKNINIADLDVIVDYGFKKHITLKFDPLEMLKPNGKIKLDYRVFDGDYDTTTTDAKNILNHFSDAPIEMHLRYENLEGDPFTSTIIPDKGQYAVKEVIALNNEESR